MSVGWRAVQDGFRSKAQYYFHELHSSQVMDACIHCALQGVVIRVSCFSALHILVNFEYGPFVPFKLKFNEFYIAVSMKQIGISIRSRQD